MDMGRFVSTSGRLIIEVRDISQPTLQLAILLESTGFRALAGSKITSSVTEELSNNEQTFWSLQCQS